jgi:ABC-type uncharacterized transport system ATPase subunit
VRPALKELEDFHSILYPLYHYFKPQKDLEKATEAVARLTEKMQILQQVTLPAKWKDREDAFKEARKELATSVSSLNASLSGKDWEVIERGIDAVHTRYEGASRLFD